MEKGLIHIYCGDGKGKTTAAVGLCVRACGCGKKVLLAQFLKDDSSGELVSLGLLPGFSRIPAPKRVKFTFQMNEEERRESAKRCAQMLQDARRAAEAGACDLLVLDECFGALSTGMLNMDAIHRRSLWPLQIMYPRSARSSIPMMLGLRHGAESNTK